MAGASSVFKGALGRSRSGSSFSKRGTRRSTSSTATLRLGGSAGVGAIGNAVDKGKRTFRTYGKKS